MRIEIDPVGDRWTVFVKDADNLRELSVVRADITDIELARALAPLGRLEGDHAWLRIASLREASHRVATAKDWASSWEQMIAYAERGGWVNVAGEVRAHIVAASTA